MFSETDISTFTFLCSIFFPNVMLMHCMCVHQAFGCICLLSGAVGYALPQTRMTAQLNGCARAAAVVLPSGCTRPVCSVGLTRSSEATAQLALPARSAMQNTSLCFPNWVGEIARIVKVWLKWWGGEVDSPKESIYFLLALNIIIFNI